MKEEHILGLQGGARWDYGAAYVRRSTISDARSIGENLRAADREELSALTLKPPVSIIADGINSAVACYTLCLRDGDRPCAIFGVNNSGNPESGIVWCLGTDDLFGIAVKFLRNSKEWLNELHSKHRLLFNVVDERQTVYIKWLKWLGFEFIEEFDKYGIEGRRFRLFTRYHV